MEKGTVLRNVNNGKVGTVVDYKEKFGQVILEVEGKNVPYNVSTIKRWWKKVEDTTPKQEVKKETPVQQNKSEITSVSEPKAPKTSSVAPKQVKEKPKSKKSNSPKTSKGPDAEVFSYIKKQAKEVGLIKMDVKGDRILVYGAKKDSGKIGRRIKFYVGNSTIRITVKNTESNIKWLKDNGYTYDIIKAPLPVSVFIQLSNTPAIDSFIGLCVK